MNGDCLELMNGIPDKSVDMILADLPYGTTANKWDSPIDSDKLWAHYKRIIKPDGIIALFAAQPFTTHLISSNLEMWRYNWVWQKEGASNFLNSHYAPLKITEDICIFAFTSVGSLSKNKIKYNPQGLVEVNIQKKNNPNSKLRKSFGYGGGNNLINTDKEFIQKYTNYPTNILFFERDKDAIHPTQKPVKLLSYLIQTYTNEGDTVLDNTMGSGSTGVAAVSLNRNFIGIELNTEYFNVAEQRIKKII
jgi:site-specific DNA-methyltransferase (adenine-specific)